MNKMHTDKLKIVDAGLELNNRSSTTVHKKEENNIKTNSTSRELKLETELKPVSQTRGRNYLNEKINRSNTRKYGRGRCERRLLKTTDSTLPVAGLFIVYLQFAQKLQHPHQPALL